MSLLSRTPVFVVDPDEDLLHTVIEIRFAKHIEALTTCGKHTVRLEEGRSLHFVDDTTIASGTCGACWRITYQ